ncbi:MAG: T9SS type A sorting domain-containing protein [Candidatus Zixiibacteriota bacterium]|nr:MAG: T9SS type A sorting domain-containing protein [candidate division Zixibacteria bacterium]
MRLLKIPFLALLTLLALAGASPAQDHIGCDDLVKSSLDSVGVISTIGKPGTTVGIPITMKADSIVTAFQFLIKFDTTWFTPVHIMDSTCVETDTLGNCITYIVDSTFIDYVIHDRFLKTDTSGPFNDIIDTVTKFSANRFQLERDVVACNFLPYLTDIDSLPGGDGRIFSILFEVDPAMQHGQLAEFSFFESDIFTVNDTVFPPETTYFDGCNQSQATTVWWDGFQTQSFQVFPTTSPGFFRADTGDVPDPTISLSANPAVLVLPANQSILSWTAENADQVVIRDHSNTIIHSTSSLSGTLSVTLPSVEGSYTYTAEASTYDKSATDDVTISVIPEGGDGPAITFTPSQLSYVIDQGETVSFAVSAAETDGDQVTLTATSLVTNSTFSPSNPAVGVGSVTGTFSFTPDFDQKGVFAFGFTAQDKDGTTTRTVQVTVQEVLMNRLFSTSAPGQQPVGGLRGAQEIMFPINLVTASTVYGVQFDMRYLASAVTVDSFVVSGRIPDWIVYDNVGQTPGDIRVVTFGLSNEPVGVDSASGSAILWAAMTLASDAQPWTTHPIYLEDGIESVSPDPDVGGQILATDYGVLEVDSLGDANLDKGINVADAVNIVASIIETYTMSARQLAAADVRPNDSVNVFDLVAVVNMIYGIPLSPTPPVLPGDTATILMAYSDLPAGSSDVLTIRSEGIPEELAGVQLEVSYDPASVVLGVPEITTDDDKFTISYRDDGAGRMKVIVYHMAPFKTDELIQIGTADLITIPVTARTGIKAGDRSVLRISDALLSTGAAVRVNVDGVDKTGGGLPTTFALHQNYPNPFNPETRITFSLSERAHVELKIYNVLGREVSTLLDAEMDANPQHEVLWDATDRFGQRVASGVYLYRLKVGDESQARKMMLLK